MRSELRRVNHDGGRRVQTTGVSEADGEDGWTAAEDLVALHTAGDVDEFHRRLVLYPTGPTNRSDAFEPWCLFHHFHKDNPDGAATTAVLLVTDRRWSNATGRFIRRIDESGLIPPEDLDFLAQTFVAAGPHVYWEVPGEWLGGPAITIDFQSKTIETEPDEEEPDDSADEGPVVVAREVRPPLRRWAAGRIVRADPGMWSKLVTRARESDPRGGAAIVHGVLDGVEGLTPAARAAVAKLATTWPQHDVREAAAAITARREPDTKSSPAEPTAPAMSQPDAAQASLF